MNRSLPHIFLVTLLFFLQNAGIPHPTQAGALSISPVRITLPSGITSGLMTVRNESPDPVRLQLSLHAWSQDPEGEMKLMPSEDLVIFPGLLQLQPNEARKVRIGLPAQQNVAIEKSYRIFLDELPEAKKLERNQVRVLARIGVPIFLQPKEPKPSLAPTIGESSAEGFLVELKNTGNVHLIIQEISITGLGAGEAPLFEEKLTGGYLLANSTRHHRIKVPADRRGKLSACRLHIVTPEGLSEETLRCTATPVAQ